MTAFIGMGLLGANFVQAMLRKGNAVNVWNRTAAKAKALEPMGAKAFDNISDAVKGADRIHLTLKDDEAVNEILDKIEAALTPGAIIIDHTTTSADGAIARTNAWKTKGFTYVHAPVFMGPQNALDSTGYMMVSGDQATLALLGPELSEMTGKLINFGTEVGKAAGMKLVGNHFLIAFTGGIADTLMLAKGLGIPATDVTALFDSWNPGAMLPARLKKMTGGTFDQPTWELNMARKDARLMIEAAAKGNVQLEVVPAIAAVMDKWIASGHGHNDWTVIGKDAIS